MLHETGDLIAADGTRLFSRRWTPETTAPVATIALVHGVHEHSGRYAYVAAALLARGIEVVAVDLRGHGQSDGERAMVDAFDDYLGDVDALVAHARKVAGDRPLFLMGHSMGGLVVARWITERGADGLAGVILSSPALALDTPRPLRALAPLLGRWLPRAPAGRLNLSVLSRNPTVARAYVDDPLCAQHGVRARLGAELLAATARVRPERFTVPLYLFHGTADRLTSPGGTKELAATAATDEVTLTLYDGFYHETLNEPERDTVIGALADWLLARTAG